MGIVGYGAYVPRYRLPAAEIARVWHGGEAALPVTEKAVPGPDEDTVTMSIEAARNALARARDRSRGDPRGVGGQRVAPLRRQAHLDDRGRGDRRHARRRWAADWQFACKAGTEAMQAAIALVGSGMAAMPWPSAWTPRRAGPATRWSTPPPPAARPTSWARPRRAWPSWRAPFPSSPTRPTSGGALTQHYPQHGGRFTGEPAYFATSRGRGAGADGRAGLQRRRFRHAVFHQPNVTFPAASPRELGFRAEQIAAGLLVAEIGNTYAGSSLIGLSAVLDVAAAGRAGPAGVVRLGRGERRLLSGE